LQKPDQNAIGGALLRLLTKPEERPKNLAENWPSLASFEAAEKCDARA
jgi:hypothetical protein